jgi:DNA mismatch endonuclease (patch repair protein)
MDTISRTRRSWNMSRIKGKDTSPELIVRSVLHSMGYRFRLHVKTLPGRPDVVLPKWRTVIFVHGCFWHRHEGCKFAYTPKSRLEFWLKKFDENVKRDAMQRAKLKAAGWKVRVVWECQTGDREALRKRLARMFVTSRKS